MTALKKAGAVIIALFIEVVLIAVLEYMGHQLYPIELSMEDILEQGPDAIPIIHLISVLIAYVIASFFSGMVLAKLSAKYWNSTGLYILGVIGTLFAAINCFTIPHPTWFVVAALLSFIPFTLLGGQLVLRRKQRSTSV